MKQWLVIRTFVALSTMVQEITRQNKSLFVHRLGKTSSWTMC